ncbi:ABC transporter ATP-binding protein [Kitasatospora indigofera]|uniref:ABC transporter ATP-binding protein n=1 Tax=Kitasatospora indigofera TaxID=67307 RepID=UPI0036386EE4
MTSSSPALPDVGRPVIELAGITRTYPGPPPVHALRPTDLTIGAGQYCAVVGPSGSGKSTLLNLLGLLDRPTLGTYLLDGVDTARLSEKHRTALRGRRIGFVFQSFHLLPYRTATENVALAHLYDAMPRGRRQEEARSALARVGLEHRLDALPTTLSGGERQRVAIARALVHRPSLLLCDEPTGNLDSATAAQVLGLFDVLHAEGMTLLVITHDANTAGRAQRTLTIRDGVLSETGRVATDHG